MKAWCVLRQCRAADVWRLQTGRMHFSIFLVYSKSQAHTDINNIGYKTHRGSALTNYYRRSAMTLIVAILDESFLFREND